MSDDRLNIVKNLTYVVADFFTGVSAATGEVVADVRRENSIARIAREEASTTDPQRQFYFGTKYELGFVEPGDCDVDQDIKRALHYYKLAADQGHGEAQYRLGRIYYKGYIASHDEFEGQDYYQARLWLLKAAEHSVGMANYYLGLIFALGKGVGCDYKKAQDYFGTSADQDEPCARTLVTILREEGLDSWIRHIRMINSSECEEAIMWGMRASKYLNEGILDKALDAYQHALQIDPYRESSWLGISDINLLMGMKNKAIDACQQALRINPVSEVNWLHLGNTYKASGVLDMAIDAYQQALKWSTDSLIKSVIISACDEVNKLNARPNSFNQPNNPVSLVVDKVDISEMPTSPVSGSAEALATLGVELAKAGRLEDGILAFLNALELNPRLATTWCNLGTAYLKSKQTDLAIEAYQKAVDINANYISAWYNLGMSYYLLSNRTDVLEVYVKLKTLDTKKSEQFYAKYVHPSQ